MSYILDALRKADADRERDPARGIHAQPAAGAAPRAASRAPGWLWPSAAALVLLAGAGFWWQGRVPAPARAVALPVPAAPPARPVVPVAAAVVPPAPPALPVPAAERPIVKAVAVAAPQSVALAPAAVAPPVPPTPAAAAPAAAAPGRVYAFAELPADVQRDLPKLAISGGVHSENAAQRMLIVGGQVLAEGAEAAPGVVIEQIRARNAVLRFRGYRYSVGF